MVYTYKHLNESLSNLTIPSFSIGKTVLGREIFCLRIGNGTKKILINATHHAMEWITSKILVQFAENYSKCLKSEFSLFIIPMVNPDGIEIHLGNEKPIHGKAERLKNHTLMNWQSNANGVDLNHNYDALWHTSKSLEPENGILGPSGTRFSGEAPESEPETRALANFTRSLKPDIAIALHTQGRVIYYDFCGHVPPRGFELGVAMAHRSGYNLEIPEGITSYGGYKDWVIKKFNRPAYTIELGYGTNPLPISNFDDIYNEFVPIIYELFENI
ncbi:MAG: M14 family zinc carboxypeptidase [Oscillospiraceae bacterium]